MGWTATSYSILLFASALVGMALTRIAWRRRNAPGAPAFALMMTGAAWWTLSYGLHLSAAVRPVPIFWWNLMFLGVVVIPAAYFAFAVQYTGRSLSSPAVALLTVHPILTTLLVWSDGAHGLFTGGWRPGTGAPFVGGVLFWVHSIYSYVLMLISTGLLVQACLRSPPLRRQQALVLLAAALVPTAANFVTIFHLNPWGRHDLTPLGFTISGVLTAWALFRYGLLDLVPVARDAVVERMRDGLLVLDRQNRLVDFNPAARKLLQLDSAALGQPVGAVLGS